MNQTRLVFVKEEYLDMLRLAESKVSTKKRPYVFLAIKIAEHFYCIPLTSQTNNARQQKGRSKRPNTFTMTISGPKGNEIAVLLFGNMVPVDESLINTCVINSEMLKDEWIFVRKNLDTIVEKAQKVYRSRTEGKNNFANLWCCDFKKLESLLAEWQQSTHSETQDSITEANEIASGKRNAKSYKNAEEMIKDVLKG
ncbi:MAG: type III toxin-antitoxin system ToxN/AbiQ family toxin [Fibrobacter sp.]|nr:type III toxin-antitoxin system ToxN/AbiQ family toxin [Fibrobacter sp.]